jgi:hypothetical protein
MIERIVPSSSTGAGVLASRFARSTSVKRATVFVKMLRCEGNKSVAVVIANELWRNVDGPLMSRDCGGGHINEDGAANTEEEAKRPNIFVVVPEHCEDRWAEHSALVFWERWVGETNTSV